MKNKISDKPFWEVPCNPITGHKINNVDKYTVQKNAFNKKYYKKNKIKE